jgi:hypothetical protein
VVPAEKDALTCHFLLSDRSTDYVYNESIIFMTTWRAWQDSNLRPTA